MQTPIPTQVDLEMFRGDDATFDLTVKDAEGKTVNLTGGTLKFTARAKSSDAAAVISKQTGSGITNTNPTFGQAAVAILPADTATLYAPKTLVYDCEFTDAGGKVTTVLPAGVLYIKRDISHA